MYKLKNLISKISSIVFKTDKLTSKEKYIYMMGKAKALDTHVEQLKNKALEDNKALLGSCQYKPYIFLNPNTGRLGVGFLLDVETVKSFDWISTHAVVMDFINSHEIIKINLSSLKTFTVASLVYILFPKSHGFMVWVLTNSMAVSSTEDKPMPTWQELSDILSKSHFWDMLEGFSKKLDYYNKDALSQSVFINKLNSYKAISNIKENLHVQSDVG
jgi:hypothetical protein